jgi:hypothetical protein
MFLTPRRKKIEADGAQESRPASSSTIFFTNLAQKGFRSDCLDDMDSSHRQDSLVKILPGAHSINVSNW